MTLENKRKRIEYKKAQQRGEVDSGFRGRGRGGRGRGRGRGQYREKRPEEDRATDEKGEEYKMAEDEILSHMLGLISDYIKYKLDKKKLKETYIYPRNQLYQMYFVMNRLNAEGFCKLDFAVNFGIPTEVKTEFCDITSSGRMNQKTVFKFFDSLEDMVLLKLHKYLFWADKKLHHVFFIDNKDQISEDLLDDFKDTDQQAFKKSEQLGKKKNARPQTAAPEKKHIENIGNKIDAEELMFGLAGKKKYVNIKDDEDFPDLDDDNDGKNKKVKLAPGAIIVHEKQTIKFEDDIRPMTVATGGGGKKNKGKRRQHQEPIQEVFKAEAELRKAKEYEKQIEQQARINKASEELAAAQHALLAFDSKQVKTKKQLKKEMEEFPMLEGQNEFMQEQRMKDFKQKI